MSDLMYQYSPTPWASNITELEVFIGNIVGKTHGQSKRQREASMNMRTGNYLTVLDCPTTAKVTRLRALGRKHNLSDPEQRSRKGGGSRAVDRMHGARA